MSRSTTASISSTVSGGSLFGEATLLPAQYCDVWNNTERRPERELAAAVLRQARADLQRYRYADTRHDQRMYWQAHEWVGSSDCEWPYSFLNICDALRLSPAAIRAGLLDDRDGEATAEAA